MIIKDELVKIGRLGKPHGIKGEVSFTFTDNSFDESECRFLICELDGIFVPFVLESCRFKTNFTAFVKFENIDSEVQTKILTNLDVYFPKKYVVEADVEEEFTWDYFIGFHLVDESRREVGEIISVDTTTINVLFVVMSGDREYLIPAAEEMIINVDSKARRLHVFLPDGLLDLE